MLRMCMCNLIFWQLFLGIVIPHFFCFWISFLGLRSRALLSISALSGRRGRFAHAYSICARFYYISQQKKYEGDVYTRERAQGITVTWIRSIRICILSHRAKRHAPDYLQWSYPGTWQEHHMIWDLESL